MIEDAREKRDKLRHLKVARYQFDTFKWDLYRDRVENINDDYADFKRVQKKIFWWLQIILRDVALKRTAYRFYEHRAEMTR